jgi:HSP20 family protein
MSHNIDPLRDLRPLRADEMDGLATGRRTMTGAPLEYDVYRTGQELVIEFDVPGVAPEELDVSIEGRMILVSLRRSLPAGPNIDVIETGRQHGVFTQRLLLGARWDVERVSAYADNGVLSVRAPLAAWTNRRQLDVKSASSAPVANDQRHERDDEEFAPGPKEAEPVHAAA